MNIENWLEGQWALILGSSSGFGAEVSKKLSDYGVNIIGVHLDRKGTISFKISDVFNTGKWRYETFTNTFFREGEGQWREPSYVLTFSYRFNDNNNKRTRRQKSNDLNFGGGDDERIFND